MSQLAQLAQSRINLNWSISMMSFDVLKKIKTKHNGIVEFKDGIFEYNPKTGEYLSKIPFSWEELQKYSPDLTLEDYIRRNPYTNEEIEELLEFGILEMCEDAWYPTYYISEKGEQLLNQYK
jgi:hypothetical protein